MQFEAIQTSDQFTHLASEWDELLQKSASHVPFLRHGYLKIWWKTLGGGEWTDGDLYVVTARHPDGALAGIAPLFYTKNRDGEPALLFLGSIEISDYLDVICPKVDLQIFIDELLEFLSKPEAPAWKVLDLYNILDQSPTLPALQQSAQKCGYAFINEPMQHCPYIPLPGDWETYLNSIDGKQRHEIRRKMRRAHDHYLNVRWYIVEDEEKLDPYVDAFIALMAQDPRKERFLTPSMRQQMRETMHLAHREGWLQLSFIEIGGEKAAVYFNFDYLNRIWVYNSGLDRQYWDLSLGWVLLTNLLQWSNENKRQAFDFLRGEEEYKYRFGAIDRRVVRAQVRR
jgi:CelD/BcsL family acetyltransferase involved in cellulose biosynthesis